MKTTYIIFTMLSCSIVFSQEYLEKQPENPEPGKCYAKCVVPDEFKEEIIEIETTPSYETLKVVPAVYKTVSTEVVIKPKSIKYINVPAVYKSVIDTVWTEDPYNKISVKAPEFKLLDKQVEVLPANESWIAGAKDPDCPSIDPNDCRIFHYRKDPAVVRTISVKSIKSPSSVVKARNGGSYKLVKSQVEVKPATTREKVIPAVTKKITKRVLVSDETTRSTTVPAKKINVTKKVLVKKGSMTAWKVVPCTLPKISGVVPIHYATGSAQLTQESKRLIEKYLLSVLKDDPSSIVEISSHTDSRGSAASNLALSERRAKVVADYLVSKGINSKRLIAIGHGENKLLNDCDDAKQCPDQKHRENRRTEFKVF